MTRRTRMTDEEKVAVKMAGILSDLRLDLDRVGVYLARLEPSVSYRRLQIMAEAAQAEKELSDVKAHHDPLF